MCGVTVRDPACFSSASEQSDRGLRSVELTCRCSYDGKYFAHVIAE